MSRMSLAPGPKLEQIRDELPHVVDLNRDWLYDTIEWAAEHPVPDTAENFQKAMEHLASATLIVNLFSTWERHWPKSEYTTHQMLFHPDNLETLLAFRHIRSTIAHSAAGHRDTVHSDEIAAFDSVMQRSSGIIRAVEYNATEIRLGHAVGTECTRFLNGVIREAINRHFAATAAVMHQVRYGDRDPMSTASGN